MKVRVRIESGEVKGGVRVRSPALGLVGHGRDQEEALENLQAVIDAWSRGLERRGELSKALRHARLASTDDGQEGVQFYFEVSMHAAHAD